MAKTIDVHCHVLHADSIEVKSFAKAYLGTTGEGWAIEAGLRFLEWYVRLRTKRGGSLMDHLLPGLAPPILPDSVPESFRDAVNELFGGMDSDSATDASDAQSVVGEILELLPGVFRFIDEFTEKPAKIAKRLQKIDKKDVPVDFFVPLMTDFENWLDGDPLWYCWKPTLIHPRTRVEFMKRLIKRNGGKIHPFAPYCPLRAAAGNPVAEADKIVDLVCFSGFLGVKLYPKLGYYPCDNETRSNSDHLPADFKGVVTWKQVDEALAILYAKCAEADVPITAHASPVGACGPYGPILDEPDWPRSDFFGQKHQAHPANWRPVLEGLPSLRLNLAHMGGDHFQKLRPEEVMTEQDWAYQATLLMADFEHVYADRSCQIPPGKNETEAVDAFGKRFVEVLGYAGPAEDRIMHGSDWHLVLLYTNRPKKIAPKFRNVIATGNFPANFAEKFFGGNAARFLGIEEDGFARDRLRDFYDMELAGSRPAWW